MSDRHAPVGGAESSLKLDARPAGEEPPATASEGRDSFGRPERTAARSRSRILLGLVLLSLALHFTGIASEVGTLYFGDEGKYQAEARRILGGEPFRPWFIYPHLLFYVDAAALWLSDQLGPVVPAVARWGAGLSRPVDVDALVLRWVTALFGALTVLPAFRAGELLGGRRAAVLGSLALLLSPIYLEICHMNLSDVPSAFFATLCVALLARLAISESPGGYALAGLAAGLAAGSKYPAGVVAVGIVAVWIAWRVRERRLRLGHLLLAGGVALAAFLATTPSLLVFPEKVFLGHGTDILFGVRQYAGKGWSGVVRASNYLYYGGLLSFNFGWIVLALGTGGLALALAQRRRVGSVGLNLIWTLVFPAVFLLLMIRLTVAVQRNLLPVLPVLAVFLGVGFDQALTRIETWLRARWRAPLVAGLVVVAFVPPAIASAVLLVRHSRPSTRQVAVRWIEDHLPAGAAILQEVYTPPIYDPRFVVEKRRYLVRFPEEQIRSPQTDYLMFADAAYGRFVGAQNDEDEGEEESEEEVRTEGRRYRQLFDELPVVVAFERERLRLGPRILILANLPKDPLFVRGATLEPPGDWRDSSIRVEGGRLRAEERGRVLFKLFLQPGRYSITARGEGLAGAGIELVSLRSTTSIRARLEDDSRCEVELPASDKYFLYVELPRGATFSGLSLDEIGR